MKATPTLPAVLLSFAVLVPTARAKPPTEPPLVPDHPFAPVWSAPTAACRRHEVALDLAAFAAVTTPALVPDQFLMTFYEPHLGLYPHIHLPSGAPVAGGIPQNGSLDDHLRLAKAQVGGAVTSDDPGLVVVDWESWRPLWDRNWGSKNVYRQRSVDHARAANPTLPPAELSRLARRQFEEAGRRFMEETLRLGEGLRPRRRWGFYLFPDCYNYGWAEPGYSGRCSAKTQAQNDQLTWLWAQSSALFPSVYLSHSLAGSASAKLYVRHRVQEALRVSELPRRPSTAPVYVYTRPVFRDRADRFLSQVDLVSTLGEAAALGAAGVVMWGASSDYDSKGECESLSGYLTSTLNPYLANVTAAAMLCSEVLCQGKGRCARRDFDSSHYLHLNPAHFSISQVEGAYVATGRPSAADVAELAEHFTCRCYAGAACEARAARPAQALRLRV